MNDSARVTFSVLVPSYNPGRYLPEALDSARAAIGPDDEIIVQDACSDDGSRELLEALAGSDPRVRPVFEKDGGQSDALNRALRRATGDWIVWLNADDVLAPGALEAVRSAVDSEPDLDVVTGDHRLIRADGETIDSFTGHPIETQTLLRRSTCASFSGSVAVRAEFLRAIGGFDDSLDATMDYELQFRIAQAHPRQTAVAAEIGALRLHDAAKTATLWRTFLTEAHMLRRRHATTPREKALAVVGTGEHLASAVVFGLRQTRGYRRARGIVTRSRHG